MLILSNILSTIRTLFSWMFLLFILFHFSGCASQQPRMARDLYSPASTDPTLTARQRRAIGANERFVPSSWQMYQEFGASRVTPPPTTTVPEQQARTTTTTQRDMSDYTDVIHTQNGKVYQVRIMSEDQDQLVVRIPDGNFIIPKSMVSHIEKKGAETPMEIRTVTD